MNHIFIKWTRTLKAINATIFIWAEQNVQYNICCPCSIKMSAWTINHGLLFFKYLPLLCLMQIIDLLVNEMNCECPETHLVQMKITRCCLVRTEQKEYKWGKSSFLWWILLKLPTKSCFHYTREHRHNVPHLSMSKQAKLQYQYKHISERAWKIFLLHQKCHHRQFNIFILLFLCLSVLKINNHKNYKYWIFTVIVTVYSANNR